MNRLLNCLLLLQVFALHARFLWFLTVISRCEHLQCRGRRFRGHFFNSELSLYHSQGLALHRFRLFFNFRFGVLFWPLIHPLLVGSHGLGSFRRRLRDWLSFDEFRDNVHLLGLPFHFFKLFLFWSSFQSFCFKGLQHFAVFSNTRLHELCAFHLNFRHHWFYFHQHFSLRLWFGLCDVYSFFFNTLVLLYFR